MTLREQLTVFNYRKVEPNLQGMYHENTHTVRIYFDTFDWFEFGIYDFEDDETGKKISKIFTKKLLETEVSSISVTDEFTMLEIYLKED